jgi:hypothetical protein
VLIDVYFIQLLMELAEGPKLPCWVPMWTTYFLVNLVITPILFRYVIQA